MRRGGFRFAWAAVVGVGLVLVGGCKSAIIGATVANQTGGAVSEVEIDYPSASFGTNTLADGSVYSYRFEVIGSGPLKASWTDAAKKNHSVDGPSLTEGLHGAMTVTLGADGGAKWDLHLTR